MNKKPIKPVIKWVGGKNRIMNKIIENIPKKFNNYYEPFIGGGSVFLNMPYRNKAYINDLDSELVNVYYVVKNEPKKLITTLKRLEKQYNKLLNMEQKKEYFLNIRNKYNNKKSRSKILMAGWYIFLNKSGFNGIMKRNKLNKLMTSFGQRVTIKLISHGDNNLLNLSKTLKKTIIKNKDYKIFLKNVKKGDFVYLDPPYVPDDIRKFNMNYVNNEWNLNEFNELFKLIKKLDKKGVYIMLSNSYSKLILNEFSNNKKFKIIKVPIQRILSRNANNRRKEYEVIITNYK